MELGSCIGLYGSSVIAVLQDILVFDLTNATIATTTTTMITSTKAKTVIIIVTESVDCGCDSRVGPGVDTGPGMETGPGISSGSAA